MKYRSLSFSILSGILLLIIACSANRAEKTKYVSFNTSLGELKVVLYNNTPAHKENMIKLVKDGFYDGIKFHRVLSEFMIQAGNPNTKDGFSEEGIKQYDYQLTAEFVEDNFHKRGVLAAARVPDNINPERKSSSTQFYIVQGKTFTSEELSLIEKRVNATLQQGIFYKNLINEKRRVQEEGDDMSAAEIQEFAAVISSDEIAEMKPFFIEESRKEIYKTLGGAPHLDTQYTVFGELVEGFDVLDKIGSVSTDRLGKPDKDILIITAKITNK